MQVIRLMGMPDKVIAFDELPMDLLDGLEMQDESKMPRHWRDFFGVREKITQIKPYVDPMTRQVVQCEPIVQKGPFTWLIDWEVNHDKDRWQEISSYVRRNAPRDFRLLDKLEDMAKPFANDAHSEITLEPEAVLIIPLPKNVEKEPEAAAVSLLKTETPPPETVTTAPQVVSTTTVVSGGVKDEQPPAIVSIAEPTKTPVGSSCSVCGKQFKGKRGMYFHMRTHKKKEPVAA